MSGDIFGVTIDQCSKIFPVQIVSHAEKPCSITTSLLTLRLSWPTGLLVSNFYPSCESESHSVMSCRGPAPADPEYSKGRRSRRPIYLFIQRYKE